MARKTARTPKKKRASAKAKKGARKSSPARKAKPAAGKRRAKTGPMPGARKTTRRKPAVRKAAGRKITAAAPARSRLSLASPRAAAAPAPEGVDLEVFREQVRFLEESFDDLAAACETAAQRTALSRDLATAQNNLARAVSAVFETGDTRVQELQREMREGQAQIEQLQINEQNIANVLNLVTGVVRAGASLVALAT